MLNGAPGWSSLTFHEGWQCQFCRECAAQPVPGPAGNPRHGYCLALRFFPSGPLFLELSRSPWRNAAANLATLVQAALMQPCHNLHAISKIGLKMLQSDSAATACAIQ